MFLSFLDTNKWTHNQKDAFYMLNVLDNSQKLQNQVQKTVSMKKSLKQIVIYVFSEIVMEAAINNIGMKFPNNFLTYYQY